MNRKIPMDGIIKCKMDKLGRLSIPVQYRRALNIEPEEDVNMIFTGEGMFVFKETREDILNRECYDIIEEAVSCEDISNEEFVNLQEILVKLLKRI